MISIDPDYRMAERGDHKIRKVTHDSGISPCIKSMTCYYRNFLETFVLTDWLDRREINGSN